MIQINSIDKDDNIKTAYIAAGEKEGEIVTLSPDGTDPAEFSPILVQAAAIMDEARRANYSDEAVAAAVKKIDEVSKTWHE